MTQITLVSALQTLAAYFPEVIRDLDFCLEVEGRQYLVDEISADIGTQDRIQGALQRLCMTAGWHYRLISRRGGTVSARVYPSAPGQGSKHSAARGQPAPHVLAIAMGKMAREITRMPTAPALAIVQPNPVAGQIMALLEERPGLTVLRIAAELGQTENVARYEVKKLVAAGQISHDPGRYDRRYYPLRTGVSGLAPDDRHKQVHPKGESA